MKPGRIYRIIHQSHDRDNDIQEVVDFSDNDYLIDDADDAEIITVEPGGRPVERFILDNSQDPLLPIKSQGLRCEINADNPITLSTFASGSDNRWGVHNYIGNKTLFRGFLVLDDMDIDFMPDPNVLVLTATDGLGLLRDQPLVDFNGENPVGDYKLIELLAMALNQTGLQLDIKAAFNIKNAGFIDPINVPNANDQHFFSLNYLWSKTFEDQIGTCINCHQVISRILGEEAFITQRQGAWWIVRVDEIEHPTRGLYITTFDYQGSFQENLGEKSFTKEVGKDDPYTMFFSREITKVRPTRPYKSVELEHQYELPKEIVDNIDFDRGDVIDDSDPNTKTFELDGWTSLFSNTSSDDAPTTPIYVERTFEAGYERSRKLVIEQSGDRNFVMSNPIRVGLRDKFILGTEFRLSADVGGSGFFRDSPIQVRLYGNDGTFWTHKGRNSINNEKRWVQCNSIFRTNQQFFDVEGDRANDMTEAMSLYDGESAEIPVAGYVRILLYSSSLNSSDRDTYYSGLSFDYRYYVNGAHSKFKGQLQKVEQSGGYKAKRDNRVYITDGVRSLFKGSLMTPLIYSTIFSGSVTFVTGNAFKISGYHLAIFRKGLRINVTGTTSNNFQTRITGVSYSIIGTETIIEVAAATAAEVDGTTTIQELTFQLATEFYNAAVYPDGPPDSTYIHPYSEIQVFDVWNQFMLDKRVFDATLQGLDLATVDSGLEINQAHLVHKWSFTDPHEDTYARFFQLLSFNQDDRTAEWKGTFREVYSILPEREKQYTGRTFKYLT